MMRVWQFAPSSASRPPQHCGMKARLHSLNTIALVSLWLTDNLFEQARQLGKALGVIIKNQSALCGPAGVAGTVAVTFLRCKAGHAAKMGVDSCRGLDD